MTLPGGVSVSCMPSDSLGLGANRRADLGSSDFVVLDRTYSYADGMDEWAKEVRRTGGTEGGWREDFPLNREMPDRLSIDCKALELPVYPMFWLRMRSFLDWHHAQGRSLSVTPPINKQARESFDQMKVLDRSYVELRANDEPIVEGDIAVLPVTRLAGYTEVEEVAEATREMLEYHYTDVSSLGSACYMAVSELCANAVEHGRNGLGGLCSRPAPKRAAKPSVHSNQ
jgi:hypothetical protein